MSDKMDKSILNIMNSIHSFFWNWKINHKNKRIDANARFYLIEHLIRHFARNGKDWQWFSNQVELLNREEIDAELKEIHKTIKDDRSD